MALFKILKGNSGNLPTTKNDGWCYVTLDEHKMYIDTSTDRFALNAVQADVALKLGTETVGSNTKPIYLNNGSPTACVDFLPLSAGEGKKLTGPIGLTENVNYGTSLPSTGFNGQLFFLEGVAGSDGGNGSDGSYLPITGGTMTGHLNMQIPDQSSNKMELWVNDTDTCLTCTNITTNNRMVLAIKESSKELRWQYYTASTDSWEGHKLWKEGDSVTGAVWNDYAECRESDCEEFGYVLTETGDDTLTKTTERLQHFAGVSSDTWGFSQGETAHARTPIAVAGRVLVYTYQDRNNYKPGDCVCAAPGGTVDIMTREEVREWPDRIVGTVSYVPTYEEWGGGEDADRKPVKVNGRIWIKVM